MNMDDSVSDMKMAGRKMPFAVPENYFEQFAGQLEKSIAPQRKPLWTLARPIVAAAAAFAGLITVSYLVLTLQNGIGAPADDYMAVRQEYAEIIADQFEEFQLEDILADADE